MTARLTAPVKAMKPTRIATPPNRAVPRRAKRSGQSSQTANTAMGRTAAGALCRTALRVHRDPVGEQLRAGVRAARVERRALVLRRRRAAEHLRGAGLVERAFERPLSRIASRRRMVPTADTSAVYSGTSKLTRTWLCAPSCRSRRARPSAAACSRSWRRSGLRSAAGGACPDGAGPGRDDRSAPC